MYASRGNIDHDHDAHVLQCSNIFDAMNARIWVPGNPKLTIEGITIPPLIVADVAYPTCRWLITPYTGNLNPQQTCFYRAHNRVRYVGVCFWLA